MLGQTQSEQKLHNEFQQQKEKLHYFWAISQKSLEERKAEHRDKEREMQDLQERHKVEIKTYKQRLKHLFYEHQDQLTSKRLGSPPLSSLSLLLLGGYD